MPRPPSSGLTPNSNFKERQIDVAPHLEAQSKQQKSKPFIANFKMQSELQPHVWQRRYNDPDFCK